MGDGSALPARRTARSLDFRWIGLAVVLAILAPGCNGMGPIARWRTASDPGIAKGLTENEKGDAGFLARIFPNRLKPPDPYVGPDPLVLDPKGWQKAGRPEANPVAAAEFKKGEEAFQKGDFAAAEAAFHRWSRSGRTRPGANGHFTGWPKANFSAGGISMRMTASSS